ncbi:hypothetical protein RHGRI_036568 [Rhododendron griersonianum]|uniref:Uncharacterized protein n=1 Tax=Rhododendron griersonianum TaxID=479676 RepID=A0AAV6HSB9_9ERIC|nr:hypothetical protein RHGRI_036568 [Rhododendron griersonianum]
MVYICLKIASADIFGTLNSLIMKFIKRRSREQIVSVVIPTRCEGGSIGFPQQSSCAWFAFMEVSSLIAQESFDLNGWVLFVSFIDENATVLAQRIRCPQRPDQSRPRPNQFRFLELAHFIPIGPNAMKVWVDVAKKPEVNLLRAPSDMTYIEEAVELPLHGLLTMLLWTLCQGNVDWLKEKIDNSSLFARDGDYDLARVGR